MRVTVPGLTNHISDMDQISALAARMSVNVNTIRNWLRGKHLQLSTAKMLARELKVPLTELQEPPKKSKKTAVK